MKVNERHLDDAQLQGYLDNDPGIDRSAIDWHLEECPSCRKELQVYRSLYDGLKDDTGLMLSADFASRVVTRVQSAENEKFDFWENGLMSLLFLVGGASVLYFTNLGSTLLGYLQIPDIALPGFMENLPLFSSGNGHLILFALVILTAFGMLDKIFLQTKHH